MYEKTVWEARQGSDLNRFEKSRETATSAILENRPTSVTKPGTPFSTAKMNKIEQGIYDAHEMICLSLRFTFVIDSDQKLADWANNVAGNDYSCVLIKAGTWTLNTTNKVNAIDITNGRTKCVVGESGSRIVINSTNTSATSCNGIRGNVTGSYPAFNDPGKEYFFFGVNIEFTNNNGESRAFSYCANLVNCTSAARGNTTYSASAFRNCINLHNCIGASTNNTGTGTTSVFYNCYNLTNCTGAGISTSTSIGFDACTNLINCTGTGMSSDSRGFHNCVRLTNCKGTGSANSGNVHGFANCTYLINCEGSANSNNGNAHAFINCRTGFGCKIINTSIVFSGCYMEQSVGSTPWGNTAAGGYNLP